MGSVRTRFAPSPTGRLHLGNLRLAAFNWLFARHHGGEFVLRIEDTDEERNLPGAEALLMEDLRWLGLFWDEGPNVGGPHAPYRQSERGPVYQAAVERLLREGKAYRCWCTDLELEDSRERVEWGEVLRYSGRCRQLSPETRAAKEAQGLPSVVRFAVPEGLETVDIVDEVRGLISFPRSDLTDFVIQRADGRPTYNFAVVADDVDMRISHVIRGVGHLSNTPKQALLFDALGSRRPLFAHLPTVLAPGGGKLSKRLGSAGADVLRGEGYDPEGVLNYVSLLGWSSEDEREVLSREELVERVSLERVGKSDTVYDPEKLRWLSAQHTTRKGPEALVAAVRPFIDGERFPLDEEALRTAVETVRSRINTYSEINKHLRFFFPEAGPGLDAARAEVREDPQARRTLELLAAGLSAVHDWSPQTLGAAVRQVGKEARVSGAARFHSLRKAVTGDASGPDIGGILAALGRAEVLARIGQTLTGNEAGGV